MAASALLARENFARLFEAIPDAVIVFDPADERVLLVNEHACRIYRREREDFVGVSLRDFSNDVELGTEQIRRTITSRDHCHFTTTQFRGDGTEIVLDVSAVSVDLDGGPAIVSINRDVSDHIGLVRRLRDTSAEWQVTVDSLDAAILLLDGDGRVLRANRYARQLASDDFFGRTLAELGSNEPWRTMHALARAAASNPERVSAHVEAPGQPDRNWYMVIDQARRANGQQCLIARASDVTSIVQLETSLRRNEAVAEMGRLVGGVAHEIRNPLFAISASLDAIESRWQPPDEVSQQHLKNLRSEINRVAELMHELLAFGRPPGLRLATERVEDLLTAAVADARRLAFEKRVSVEVNVNADAGSLEVDRGRMLTALRNLVENAILHSPEGEHVTLRARHVESHSRIAITVEDRGRGFEPADLQRVFEPFFTKRRGGTGLGLSLTKQTVELHGGRIKAENRGGGGARFTIELPHKSS